MGFLRGMKQDWVALERRQMQAAQLLEQGHSETELARRLDVHRQSASRWVKTLDTAGRDGLRRAASAGQRPKLSEEEISSATG